MEQKLMPLKVTRSRLRKTKAVRRHAAELLSTIGEGESLLCLHKGQAGVMEFIEALLDKLGPSPVLLVTWTIGLYEATRLRAALDDGRATELKVLVDRSYGTRLRDDRQLVVDLIGEYTRSTSIHAKIACVGDWTVHGSANTNKTVRIEQLCIESDPAVAAWVRDELSCLDALPIGIPSTPLEQSRARLDLHHFGGGGTRPASRSKAWNHGLNIRFT